KRGRTDLWYSIRVAWLMDDGSEAEVTYVRQPYHDRYHFLEFVQLSRGQALGPETVWAAAWKGDGGPGAEHQGRTASDRSTSADGGRRDVASEDAVDLDEREVAGVHRGVELGDEGLALGPGVVGARDRHRAVAVGDRRRHLRRPGDGVQRDVRAHRQAAHDLMDRLAASEHPDAVREPVHIRLDRAGVVAFDLRDQGAKVLGAAGEPLADDAARLGRHPQAV
ncbi:hypothetical protein HK102_012640, partial [Quaeritorhiza haematococci]